MPRLVSCARLDALPIRHKCSLYAYVHDICSAISEALPRGTIMIITSDIVRKELVTYVPFCVDREIYFRWDAYMEDLRKRRANRPRLPEIPGNMAVLRFSSCHGLLASMVEYCTQSGVLHTAGVNHNGWYHYGRPSGKRRSDTSTVMGVHQFKGTTFHSLKEIAERLTPSTDDVRSKLCERYLYFVAEHFFNLLIDSGRPQSNQMEFSGQESSENLSSTNLSCEDVEGYFNDNKSIDGRMPDSYLMIPCGHVVPCGHEENSLKSYLLYLPDEPCPSQGQRNEYSKIAQKIIAQNEAARTCIQSIRGMPLENFTWRRLHKDKKQFLQNWSDRFGCWNIPFWQLDLDELVTLLLGPILKYDLHLQFDSGHRWRETLPYDTVVNFFKYTIACYNDSAYYHNGYHGCQVLHATFLITSESVCCPEIGSTTGNNGGNNIAITSLLSKTDLTALLMAALCHDVDHPMLTNYFLRSINHPIAARYNDRSVLENYHASFIFQHILSRRECNITELWCPQKRNNFRKSFICAILATDMEFHAQGILAAKERIELHKKGKRPLNYHSESDRIFLIESIIRLADASNPSLPFPAVAIWGSAIAEEFVLQNISEYELGVGDTHYYRLEAKKEKATMLHEFANLIVTPLFKQFSTLMPCIAARMRWLDGACRFWENVVDYYKKLENWERSKECSDETESVLPSPWINLGAWSSEFGNWGKGGHDGKCDHTGMGCAWQRMVVIWGSGELSVPVLDSREELDTLINKENSAYLPVAYVRTHLPVKSSRSGSVYPHLHGPSYDGGGPHTTETRQEMDDNVDLIEGRDIYADARYIFDYPKLFREHYRKTALPFTQRNTECSRWPSPVNLDSISFEDVFLPSTLVKGCNGLDCLTNWQRSKDNDDGE